MSKIIFSFFFACIASFSTLTASPISVPDTNVVHSVPTKTHEIPLSVSPNPTQDFVNISYQFASPAAVEIKLEDAQGVALFEDILQADEKGEATVTLDVRDFEAGTYYITIQTPTQPLKMEFTKE